MENQTAESRVLPELEQLSTNEVKPSYNIKQRLRTILAENRIGWLGFYLREAGKRHLRLLDGGDDFLTCLLLNIEN